METVGLGMIGTTLYTPQQQWSMTTTTTVEYDNSREAPLAALASDSVDLVNEDDAGRVLASLLEQIAYSARPHPDEHLDEVRTLKGVILSWTMQKYTCKGKKNGGENHVIFTRMVRKYMEGEKKKKKEGEARVMLSCMMQKKTAEK